MVEIYRVVHNFGVLPYEPRAACFAESMGASLALTRLFRNCLWAAETQTRAGRHAGRQAGTDECRF